MTDRGAIGILPEMAIEPDVLVVNATGWPIAAVEVKNRPALGVADAKTYRRNLFAHGVLSQPIDFVVIVSQDKGYLWGPTKKDDLGADPDMVFDMAPVLERYGVSTGGPRRLYGAQLELFVSSWLREMANGAAPPSTDAERALEKSGLAAEIRSGRIIEATA